VEAAVTAMREDGSWRLPPLDLQFRRRPAAAGTTLDYLEMVRPSGEAVRYLVPELVQRQRGNIVDQLIHHSVVKGSVLLRRELRLSELAEHCASSIARDTLADALVRADAAGWRVVLAVHDELVIETPAATADQALRDLLALMTTQPRWWDPKAPLMAEGAVVPRYQKI
jgi:DNA polymerase